MPAFIMGGLALAQGVFSGIMGGGTAKAAAMQAELQAQNANFQRKWQGDSENRNMLRQYQQQLQTNMQIESLATRERAIGEIGLKNTFNNTRSDLSKQTTQTNDMFLSGVSSRGLSSDSASVKALLRQNNKLAQNNMGTLRANYGSSLMDIENQYKNRLASRNNGFVSQRAILNQPAISVDGSSGALMGGIAQGVIGAIGAGYSAHLEYGRGAPSGADATWGNRGGSRAD
jgi:hypothetical protein